MGLSWKVRGGVRSCIPDWVTYMELGMTCLSGTDKPACPFLRCERNEGVVINRVSAVVPHLICRNDISIAGGAGGGGGPLLVAWTTSVPQY